MPAHSFKAFKLIFICLISLPAPVATLRCSQQRVWAPPALQPCCGEGRAQPQLCPDSPGGAELPANPCKLPPTWIPAHRTAIYSLVSSYCSRQRQPLQTTWGNRGTPIKPLHAAVSQTLLMQDANPIAWISPCGQHRSSEEGEAESYTADFLPQRAPKLWYFSCALRQDQHGCCGHACMHACSHPRLVLGKG